MAGGGMITINVGDQELRTSGIHASLHRIANYTAPPTLVGTVSGDEQAPAAIAVARVSAAPCTVFTLPDAELGASTAP